MVRYVFKCLRLFFRELIEVYRPEYIFLPVEKKHLFPVQKELVEFEAESQYAEMVRNKQHEKNLQAAEVQARKLLDNVELEAHMTAQ